MGLWSRKKKKEENPFITFRLIDGVHLEIEIAWPPDCNIEPFAQLLVLLNSGNVAGPILNEAVLYARTINRPQHAEVIRTAMESNKKKEKPSHDKPLVPPSKAIFFQMKNFNQT